MSWEFLLITIFSCIFQSFILYIVYGTLGKTIFNKKIYVLILYIIYNIITCLISIFVSNQIISIISALFLIYILGAFYKLGLIKRVIAPLILFGLFAGAEMLIGGITTSITDVSIEQQQSSPFFYMQGMIGSKIIVFFIALLVRNFLKKQSIKGSFVLGAFFVVMPIITNVLLYIIQVVMYSLDSKQMHILSLIASLCFILTIIAMIYIMDYSIRANYHKNQIKIVNNALQEQIKAYSALIENYKFNNKQMHDINNQIILLKGMCMKDEDCIQEIENVSNIVQSAQHIVYTSIPSLDAILNSKINEIQSLQIPFEKQIMLSELNVDSIKLSILVANLLDNSIEESKRLQELGQDCKINFKLQSISENLSIAIKNNSRGIIKEKTAKTNKFKHGYGTQIIQKIVNDFGGSIIVNQAENDYSVSILISKIAS